MVEDLIPCEDEREKILLQAALKFVEHHRAGRVQCQHELVSLIRLPPETITCYSLLVSGCVVPSPCRPKLRRPNLSYVTPTSKLCRPNLTYSINSNGL